MRGRKVVFTLEDRVRAVLTAAAESVPAMARDPGDAAIARAHRTIQRRRVGYVVVVALSLLIGGAALMPGSGHPRGVLVTPRGYASRSAGARAGVTGPSSRYGPPRPPASSRSPSRPGYRSPVGTAWGGLPRGGAIRSVVIKPDVIRLDSARPVLGTVRVSDSAGRGARRLV